MENFTTVHTETREEFYVSFAWAYETFDPCEHFDDSLIDEILEGIEAGKYAWFVARVTVSKNGIKLADDYLGGCLYESFDEFVKDGYYTDMVETAISEAKINISKLLEGYNHAKHS